jgi:polyribonucleotide nucleotidyltransferase
MMVEGGALEVPEEEIAEGLQVAHEGIKELIGIQKELLAQLDRPEEMAWSPKEAEPTLVERVTKAATTRVREALNIADKAERGTAMSAIKTEITQQIADEIPTRISRTSAGSSRRSRSARCARWCSRPGSARTGAAWTRCARSASSWACSRARTARRSSPAGRRSRSAW